MALYALDGAGPPNHPNKRNTADVDDRVLDQVSNKQNNICFVPYLSCAASMFFLLAVFICLCGWCGLLTTAILP
jgi:hypothetical protein